MRAITLDEAVQIINETFAEAKRRNAYPLTAVLLDAGGRMKAALKQDGASLLRFEVSYGKAYAALAMGRESRQVLQKAKDKPLFMQSLVELADGPMFLEGGGQLIRDKDGEVVGAIATTGDTNEVDDLCAIAGIRASGFNLAASAVRNGRRLIGVVFGGTSAVPLPAAFWPATITLVAAGWLAVRRNRLRRI